MKFVKLSLLVVLMLLMSSGTTTMASSFSVVSVGPEAAKQPVKPIKKKVKAQRRHEKSILKHRKGGDNQALLISFWVLTFLSAILFGLGVGLNIFGLWLAALIGLGLCNLFNFFLYVFLFTAGNKRGEDLGDGVALAIFLGLLVVMNLIFGATFLIWGLLSAIQLLWIPGAILLLFAFIPIVIFLITGDERKRQ